MMIRNQSTGICKKTIYIIQEMINVNKLRLKDIMSLSRNKKERYMLKEIKIMTNISFMTNWVKTTISFFTFTIS